MSLRIPSNKKTSQGILIAPLYSYPNSSTEASSISANRGWLRTLASITNLIRISFPTYTGRDPLATRSLFLVTELCLLFSFFFNLINDDGGLEEWISETLCSKRVNCTFWTRLQGSRPLPDWSEPVANSKKTLNQMLEHWKSATEGEYWDPNKLKNKMGGRILYCKILCTMIQYANLRCYIVS